jgi:zinc transport system permease protein
MFVIIIVSFLIGLIFAPLGCLVLWKRYVYFGDGLAHASMLAGIISIMMGIPLFYAGLLSSGLFALAIFKLRNNSGNNAAIALTSSVMISLSLILSHFYPDKINITRYLVGDIIAANMQDIQLLLSILAVVLIFFASSYKELILIILSKDVAASRGIKVKFLELIFLAILSFAVLSTIKIVGALLVTSTIVIPAMIARIIAKSPLVMIGLAIIFSIIMNFFGVLLSFYGDIPFSPAIIISGGALYISIFSIKYFNNQSKNNIF